MKIYCSGKRLTERREVCMRGKRKDGALVSSKREMKAVWKGHSECLINEESQEGNCVKYGYGSKWKVDVCAEKD